MLLARSIVSLTDIRPKRSSSSGFGASGMVSSRLMLSSASPVTATFDWTFFASALFKAIASRMLRGVAGTGGGISADFCFEGVVALDDVDCVLIRGVDTAVVVVRNVD